MIGDSKLLSSLASVVRRVKADGVSVCAHARVRSVFRFAYEAMHQALAQETVSVTVKMIRNGRVGVASTDSLDATHLARCAAAAGAIAAHAKRQERIPALPHGHRLISRRDYIPATAHASPASCVEALIPLFQLCQGAGAALAGSYVTGEDEFAVVNSAGTACYAASTVAGAKLVTMYRRLSGYASGVHQDVDRLDLEGLLRRSLAQSLHQEEPVMLPLGAYEVILEPEAVGELLIWLGYTAFGAKHMAERTSCLAGRMGERLFSPLLTIYDNGMEPSGLRLPFDFEGSPKRKVMLVDRGVAAGFVCDMLYGERFGQASTGHGMPPDEVDGPLPLNLAIAPGRATLPGMIRACKRGLLIPRFHYVNGLLNPREALMTGLTREGAFLIERGRLSAPVSTLRFTQSLLEAFSRIVSVSRERRLIADPSQELGCAVVPALHLEAFRFTGRSER